jgi:co-chaperonin GroES (HSP10)
MAKKLNLHPSPGRVIVKPLEDDEKTTPGGIVLPESARAVCWTAASMRRCISSRG